MFREAMFRLSQQRGLRDLATRNGVARKMASRFVAGETLDEALAAVRDINARGMTATLDHLGENVRTVAQASADARAARNIVETLARSDAKCNASLKLTQLGLDLGDEVAITNMESVLAEARPSNTFIRIDMEGSEYVERTLSVFYRLFREHSNVGIVIQSYLYRSKHDLERLTDAGARVRLVKGAYLEGVDVAYQRKEDVDANYVSLMQMLLARGDYPAIATHDPAMIEATKAYAREQDIAPSRFEFQMLYGIRRDLQAKLVAEGYNMRIYVPYGTEWYPYLMRRMAERPANVVFVLSNISREAIAARR